MKDIFVWDLTEHFSNQTLLAFFQSSKDQRLVYSGRLLQDHLQLRDVLRKVQSCSLICLNIKSDAPYKNKSSDLKRSLMLLQTVWVFLIVEMLKLPLKFIDPKTVVTPNQIIIFFLIFMAHLLGHPTTNDLGVIFILVIYVLKSAWNWISPYLFSKMVLLILLLMVRPCRCFIIKNSFVIEKFQAHCYTLLHSDVS